MTVFFQGWMYKRLDVVKLYIGRGVNVGHIAGIAETALHLVCRHKKLSKDQGNLRLIVHQYLPILYRLVMSERGSYVLGLKLVASTVTLLLLVCRRHANSAAITAVAAPAISKLPLDVHTSSK
ncbi:hypothetical protein BDV40DRAFT_133579 [Aspergillus tamarii]|uniref:Uncharacterized protein n=1 Tax=Aspergillus tamarii TaxID=41984 RepID=A0A5N6V0U2_ASPTM|nr:hypothetical protein BDV40DRAFT_133579 [Aspergillus tamarii]